MTIKYAYVACVPIKKASKEILCGPKEHLHVQVPSYIKTDMQLAVLLAVDLLQHVLYNLEGEQESRQPQKGIIGQIFSAFKNLAICFSIFLPLLKMLHSQNREGQNRSLQPLPPNSFQNQTSRNSDMLMS